MRIRPWGPSHLTYLALLCAVMQVIVLSGQDGVTVGRTAFAQTARSSDATLASSAGVDVRTIQRLLNQLSEGDPKRYGAVNPGPINGVLNQRTKSAIRNFMRIKSMVGPPNVNRNLWSQLISAQLDLPPMQTGVRRYGSTGKCGLGVSAAACAESVRAEAQPTVAQPKAAEPRQAVDTRVAERTPTAQKTAAAKAPPARPGRRGTKIPAIQFKKGRSRSFYIQLASLVSEKAARNHWRKISGKNAKLLKTADVAIERAVLKGDRVYFRLLLGPFLDLPEARHFCSMLKRNKQKCLVQTRKGRAVVMEGGAIIAGGARSSSVVATDRLPASPPTQPRRTVVSEPLAPIQVPVLPKPAVAVTPRIEDSKNSEAAPQRHAALVPPTSAPTDKQGAQQGVSGRSPQAIPDLPETGQTIAALPASPDNGAAKAGMDQKSRSNAGDHIAVLSKGVVVVPARGDDGSGGQPPIVGRRWFDVVFQRVWLFLSGWGGLATAILVAAWFAVSYRRSRRRSVQNSAFADALNEAEEVQDSEQATAEGDIVAEILRSFDSAQLRESRSARDIFLQDVFEVASVTAVPAEKEGSAMLVNSCLKDLLSKEPSKYKLIFLNWVFLNQVGVALNRKELLMDQLDRAIGREVDLVRSCFKIHLLELDHRHRLCDRLPGLFYCLQNSDS